MHYWHKLDELAKMNHEYESEARLERICAKMWDQNVTNINEYNLVDLLAQ